MRLGKLKKLKEGFTLIELIVVLIVLGILTAIALPALFLWIPRSHAGEASTNIENYANKVDACISLGGVNSSCLAASGLQMSPLPRSSNFEYVPVAIPNSPFVAYEITALPIDSAGNILDYTSPATEMPSCAGMGIGSDADWIQLCVTSPGQRTITGGGIYTEIF